MNKSFFIYKLPGRIIVYFYALLLIVPMYFIVVTSLKTGADITTNPLGLPKEWIFSNYKDAFIKAKMLKASLNSIIVSVTVVSGGLINITLVTYCLHKMMHKRIGRVIYAMIIGTMILPSGGVVPFILMMMKLKLYNNLLGLIVPGIFGGLAFNVLILMNFIQSMPKDIEDAARIDGCGDFQYFFKVLIPLIKPALTALGILLLVGSWNSLFGPLVMLRNPELYTLPLAILTFKGMYHVDYNLIFAAITMAGLPLVVIYLKYQKYFTEALAGSIKG